MKLLELLSSMHKSCLELATDKSISEEKRCILVRRAETLLSTMRLLASIVSSDQEMLVSGHEGAVFQLEEIDSQLKEFVSSVDREAFKNWAPKVLCLVDEAIAITAGYVRQIR